MKKYVLCLVVLLSLSANAFDYVPKNTEVNPFSGNQKTQVNKNLKKSSESNELREIKNITEYFKYLPHEVNRNWTPYRANTNYEVTVQFKVHRNGSISDIQITNTTNPRANYSVLNAVKSGAPYQPLPKSYTNDSVTAQVFLEYQK